jgi:uncharacterized LabA/DUF88 family protein
MANGDKALRLAVLIDADNASARIVDGLFEEIAKIGQATARRIYGDFASPHSKAWVDVLARYALNPQQQFAYTTGKNASDITLVIDAMDLLHSGRFDGFCLVSSDSDFTRLASRIREEGIEVYGIGEQKTPESFRQACTRFIYSENLLPSEPPKPGAPVAAKALKPTQNAADMIKRIMGEMETDQGWVSLAVLGARLLNFASDFDSRTYGFKKLSDLVRGIPTFEVRQEGGQLKVRVRPTKGAKPKP